MKAWLMDIYRARDKLVLWLKDHDKDIRLEKEYKPRVYIDAVPEAEKYLRKRKIPYKLIRKKNYRSQYQPVYEVSPIQFERFIRNFERTTRHRISLYNADVKPEQDYLYSHGLTPFGLVEIHGDQIIQSDQEVPIPLLKIHIALDGQNVILDGISCTLKEFARRFKSIDPDVIVMPRAFQLLPMLNEMLARQDISCLFHRFDPVPLKYKGGKTFYSYGQTAFRDYSIRLNGRFLVDSSSHIGTECELDAIIELCQLSGTFFQQVSARSFGAVFQQSLVRKMVEKDYLIPYKEKPVEIPISMHTLVKADRVGHTFDPIVGFHKDVAEIDFSSMYPWIMYNRNISAETIQSGKPPFEKVPGLPFKLTLSKKGLVPQALKAILDRRMQYKRNPSSINNAKSAGLKWVLVSSYGYCRFREFKLGIATTHMAIGAFAREIILEAARMAEGRGFQVVHGIIDSLYIKKKGIKEEEVKALCNEIEQMTGIPVSFDGIFKWVVFLPSINDDKRPLPARYYGVFRHGCIKARGIEVRQKSQPRILREFQRAAIQIMASCSSKSEIIARLPEIRRLLERTAESIAKLPADWLCFNIKVSKTDYSCNIAQKTAVDAIKSKGQEVYPGQNVSYVHTKKGIVLAKDYNGGADIGTYQKLLKRGLFVLFQAFGYTRETLKDALADERQTMIHEYFPVIKQVYHHVHKLPENRRGYSERVIRKKLEKGWIVWRGGYINALNQTELYPNVRKKYEILERLMNKHHPGKLEQLKLLCSVHHGMPDLLAYRDGFKFVECKLIYEQLSKRQKACIQKLLDLGFSVEVHRIVDHRTKARLAEIDMNTGQKRILEVQLMLKN